MAQVTILIKDEGQGIAIDINALPMLPENTFMYTNAQMVAKDIISMIAEYTRQINTKAQQENITQAIESQL